MQNGTRICLVASVFGDEKVVCPFWDREWKRKDNEHGFFSFRLLKRYSWDSKHIFSSIQLIDEFDYEVLLSNPKELRCGLSVCVEVFVLPGLVYDMTDFCS